MAHQYGLGLATEWIEIPSCEFKTLANGLGLATEWIEISHHEASR